MCSSDLELSGGYSGADLPEYRGPFDAIVLADVYGPFGSATKNYPLPPLAFPEDMRDGRLFKALVTHPWVTGGQEAADSSHRG